MNGARTRTYRRRGDTFEQGGWIHNPAPKELAPHYSIFWTLLLLFTVGLVLTFALLVFSGHGDATPAAGWTWDDVVALTGLS